MLGMCSVALRVRRPQTETIRTSQGRGDPRPDGLLDFSLTCSDTAPQRSKYKNMWCLSPQKPYGLLGTRWAVVIMWRWPGER